MTRKLEELLNLAPSSPKDEELNTSPKETEQFIKDNQSLLTELDTAIDKIDTALPTVRDLDTADEELDELANLAKEKFQDMVDLGMAVEPRFSGVILQTAGTLLGHAITAKTAKLDKKLRMVQLQLQKAKLDHQREKDNKKEEESADDAIDGKGILLDRNELLKSILGKKDN